MWSYKKAVGLVWRTSGGISCRSSCSRVSSLHFQLPRIGREVEKVFTVFTDELRELETPSMLSTCLHKSAFQSASFNKSSTFQCLWVHLFSFLRIL